MLRIFRGVKSFGIGAVLSAGSAGVSCSGAKKHTFSTTLLTIGLEFGASLSELGSRGGGV